MAGRRLCYFRKCIRGAAYAEFFRTAKHQIPSPQPFLSLTASEAQPYNGFGAGGTRWLSLNVSDILTIIQHHY